MRVLDQQQIPLAYNVEIIGWKGKNPCLKEYCSLEIKAVMFASMIKFHTKETADQDYVHTMLAHCKSSLKFDGCRI